MARSGLDHSPKEVPTPLTGLQLRIASTSRRITLPSKGKPLTLGKAIGEAKETLARRWLALQSNLNDVGVDATHHFGTPSSAMIQANCLASSGTQ